MKRLLLPLLAALVLPISTFAGLGDAESPSKREFNAWCGKIKNNCKVVFTDKRLSVNGNEGISRSQVVDFTYERDYLAWSINNHYYYTISYEELGVIKSGKFIFANKDASKEFKRTLMWFCSNCEKVYNPIEK